MHISPKKLPGDVTSDVQDEDAVLSRHRFVKMIKDQGGQAGEGRIRDCLNRSRAREGFQNAHLAEEVAGSKLREFDFVRLAKMFADSDLSLADDEQAVAGFALANDHFARSSFDFLGAFPEQSEGGFIEAGKNRHVL